MKTHNQYFTVITILYLIVMLVTIFLGSSLLLGGSGNFGRYMADVYYGHSHMLEVSAVIFSTVLTWLLAFAMFKSESIEKIGVPEIFNWVLGMSFLAYFILFVLVVITIIVSLIWQFGAKVLIDFVAGFNTGR